MKTVRRLRASFPHPGRKTALMALGLVMGFVLLGISSVEAVEDPGEPVTMVEEDWVLVLYEPDDEVEAPQFHTVMSPYGHLDSTYMQVTWNYWEQPTFQPGGIQIQAWDGDECALDRGAHDLEQLSTDAETITWTQALVTNGEVLFVQILNGQSQTWGSFGGENMKLQGEIHIADLNQYRPETSVMNSWITYGANRVELLGVTEVRYYGASGLLYRDTTPRVIYSLEPN